MQTFFRGFLLFLAFVVISTAKSWATHIRAGEITVVRENCQSRTFLITVTGYVDLESTVEFGGGELSFGDGSDPINLRASAELIQEQNLGNNVGIVQFQYRHTYGANGVYTLSYFEQNRNAGIINMSNSVDTPFYIETQIILDSFLGCNNTPVLLIPPVDEGCVGSIFFHNPGGFDQDGDSLSYELTIPKRREDTDVNNYVFPNDPSFSGTTEDGLVPTTFSIDPLTGDVKWDAPAVAGEYNIAFIVREWRLVGGVYKFMGLVTRDMQIIIEDCDNERPELEIPEDICVAAGELIQENIFGTDPDGDQVRISAFGGPFEFGSTSAVVRPDPPEFQPVRATLEFEWQTVCNHVRVQPYQVTFKIEDDPPEGPNLVGFEPWNITVVGPAPTGLSVDIQNDRTAQVSWDPYVCDNADRVQIWRRVDSYDFEIDNCVTGIPDSAGYELVGEVLVGESAFLDENRTYNPLAILEENKFGAARFLDFGANYCYRLVAVFPEPAGGESYASVEVCGIVKADAPVITHVTVDETNDPFTNGAGPEEGAITVSWKPPFEIDQVLFPPPYFYDVQQASISTLIENLDKPDVLDTLLEFTTVASDLSDTTIQFTGLNTRDLTYFYRIVLKDSNGGVIRTGSVASNPLLELTSFPDVIELRWDAYVPWTINSQEYPEHLIFREVKAGPNPSSPPTELTQIATVNVNERGFFYSDDGSHDGQPLDEDNFYCYYVVTRGSYGNPLIKKPQLNLTPIGCAQPSDETKPCPPVLQLVGPNCEELLSDKACGFNDFFNLIEWESDPTLDLPDSCSNRDIRRFNIYVSEDGENFEILETLSSGENTYLDADLSTLAYCYYVTAVDRSNNESDPSNIVCNDNCPSYKLPNVFTPNGDGFNDRFYALNDDQDPDLNPADCPRFVDKVVFGVYNRWGKEVFSYTSGGENSILIGWDGKDSSGDLLPQGVYYYVAEVDFNVIDPSKQTQVLKGWVQILY